MAKRRTRDNAQGDLLDVTPALLTGPCVPALREAVKAWRVGGHKGITDTTRTLLNYWFKADHRLASGVPFKYHASQQEAIETLIFVWEFEKVRSRKALLERYAQNVPGLSLPLTDDFPRYCTKMATGSGKTKVTALAVAWQFLNAAREVAAIAKDYAKTFLVIAPNVIVLERLRGDFSSGAIFRADPIIPKELEIFWDFDCVMRGEGERAHSEGLLFLTNIQQFYERPDREGDEPEAMTGVLGPKPPTKKLELTDFGDRIALRAGKLLIINDEAHHVHDEELKWVEVIQRLHARTPIAAQLDFSATPKFQKGGIFPWTVSDYPLKQAIRHRIVKQPMKGVARIDEAKSTHASVRYQGHLTAGVERWREYRQQLLPLRKKPVLFIMMNSTDEADDVADWLRTKYPEDFGNHRTQVIHTDKSGEVSKKELDAAREAVRSVDAQENPINAIVSVLMLREGWDVQNVTVVVGLRPYTAKANILPEQTIGRGLRLMFRNMPVGNYVERVDIIGNQAFLDFVDDLEKLEELKFGTFEVGKDKLMILSVAADPNKNEFDIGLPTLTPILVRKKSLAQEIAEFDVTGLQTIVLPMSEDDAAAKTFRYEGYDIITLKKLVEREYAIPEPQTAQELIGFYARQIATAVKLPAQFAALAPKVREFFEFKAFGCRADLDDAKIVKAMNTSIASYVCVDVFKKALLGLTIEQRKPELLEPARMLSGCAPFPWSRAIWEGRKTVFNVVACDNDFERDFAKFLDGARDVKSFAKLPQQFGFAIEYTDSAMNLRSYYPDFVAVAEDGAHWLLETKGQETADVPRKDAAAARWCENATALTDKGWRYLKVPQKDFEALRPTRLADLTALRAGVGQ